MSAACVLRQITFEVHMEAEVDTDVLILNSSTLNTLMESNIRVENFVYKLTAERFSDVMWAMRQLCFSGLTAGSQHIYIINWLNILTLA